MYTPITKIRYALKTKFCIFIMKDYLYLQLPAIESRFGYDYEDRQSCKCETSQKITRCLFDSVLIIQFVTLFRLQRTNRNQQTIVLISSPMLPLFSVHHARIQRGGRGSGPTPSLKNHKNIGFLSTTGPDPLKITKLLSQYPCWPSSAHQQNAI